MRLSFLLLGVVAAVVILGASATPLDDYVHAPDPTYRWSLNATHTGWLGYKVPLSNSFHGSELTEPSVDLRVGADLANLVDHQGFRHAGVAPLEYVS